MSATLLSGSFGDIQIIAAKDGVTLDLQGTKRWTADGTREPNHGYAKIDVDDAIRIWHELSKAIIDARLQAGLPSTRLLP